MCYSLTGVEDSSLLVSQGFAGVLVAYVVVNYHSCLLECSLNVYSVVLNCRPLGVGFVRTFVAELEEGAVSACDGGW